MLLKFEDYEINIEEEYVIKLETIDDFREKILNSYHIDKTLEVLTNLKNEIDYMVENRKNLRILLDRKKAFKDRVNLIIKDLNEVMKLHYKSIIDDAIKYITTENSKSSLFIIKNADKIKEVIDAELDGIINKIKVNRKASNDKYYEKRKELLGIKAKKPLTLEQIKANKQIANAKYYEKRKNLIEQQIKPKEPLTEEEVKLKVEQIKEKQKIANAKYYASRKELLGLKAKEPLTEEEVKLKVEQIKANRKASNDKYYEKRKELLGIKTRGEKLTEEQIKANKKDANLKYREKQKEKKLIKLIN